MCKITEETIIKIWNKGLIVEGYDPAKIRKDACGAWIRFDKFNDRTSIFGWEIDHIYPVKKLRERRISDEVSEAEINLRPLNWLNNESKGADYPVYHAKVISEDDKNKRGDYQFEISKELQNQLTALLFEYL